MCMNECTLLVSDKISFRQFSRFWGELCPGDVLVASPGVHFFHFKFFCHFGQFQFISGCKCEFVYNCGNFNSYLYLCLFVFVYSCICFHQFVQFWVELCPGVQFLRLLMFWRTWVQPGGSPCVKAPKVKKKSSFWQCNIKSHILKQQNWKWKNLGNIKWHVPKCTKTEKNEIINFRIPNYEWVSQKNHLKYEMHTFKAPTIISCPHILFNDLFPLILCSWTTK